MAYCGHTQLVSQAGRQNRDNHAALLPVFVVKSVKNETTRNQQIPRLEIHGEDGDGPIRCVFWWGQAEAAAALEKIVGEVVSCKVERCHAEGQVVVCERCRDLRVVWRAGDAPHSNAVVRRVAGGAARPAKRPRRAPAGSYWSPLPLGAAVQSPKSVWTRAAISVAQPRIGRGESDQAVGRLLMMVLNGDAPLILRLRDDGTSIDCKATPQLARALHFCLSGDDVDTCVAHAITAGQKHRRLQNGIPSIECKLSPGPVVSGIALLKEDASWTPPSAPSTSR